MDHHERRRYKRLKADWVAGVRTVELTDTSIERLKHVRNVSLGGVFIEAERTLEPGTTIEFEFIVSSHGEVVKAKGVVRWVDDGSEEGNPRGMGVEFLEVQGGSQEVIHDYVQAESGRERLELLTRTPLHEKLLRFYQENSGGIFTIVDLAAKLECGGSDLMECLKDFSLYQLVRFEGDKVGLLASEDQELARAIQTWFPGRSGA